MNPGNKEDLILVGMSAAFAVVAGLCVLIAVEVFVGTWRDDPSPVVVAWKSFTPSSTAFGSGLAHNPEGGPSVVMTTNHSPEEWTVIVKIGDEVVPIATTSAQWVTIEPGQRVTLQRSRSPVFGFSNGMRIKGIGKDRTP